VGIGFDGADHMKTSLIAHLESDHRVERVRQTRDGGVYILTKDGKKFRLDVLELDDDALVRI